MYYFQSVICHPHIKLEMLQSSHRVLVNTGFSKSLYKTICFDHTIKAYIPTPRCLHQSINGSLELAHFLAPFGSTKPSGCIIYNSSLRYPLRNAVLKSICQIS